MRKDDWITKLYYRQLNDRQKHNRNSGKDVSCKKKNTIKSVKFKNK